MVRWVMISLAGLLLLSGCGAGTFQVPKEEFRQQVRVLTVLPLMVDHDSQIRHPQRAAVLTLLDQQSLERHEYLAEMLRQGGGFFDVRAVRAEPRELLSRITQGFVEGQPDFPYQISAAALAQIARAEVADAVLVVVLHGRVAADRRWERGRPNYLDGSFNDIWVAAAVIDPQGQVLWHLGDDLGERFLPLQYPDFDEAHFNKTNVVNLKFITTEGLERTLIEPAGGLLTRSAYPKPYADLFGRIAQGLKPGLFSSRGAAPTEGGGR